MHTAANWDMAFMTYDAISDPRGSIFCSDKYSSAMCIILMRYYEKGGKRVSRGCMILVLWKIQIHIEFTYIGLYFNKIFTSSEHTHRLITIVGELVTA